MSAYVRVAASDAQLLDRDLPFSTQAQLLGNEALQHAVHRKPRLSFDSLADLAQAAAVSPWSAVERVVQESLLLLKLAWRLWAYLGVGYRWTVSFYRLVLYAILLLPGFIQIIFFYFCSGRVIRSIPYGRQPRQRLDMYLPPEGDCDDCEDCDKGGQAKGGDPKGGEDPKYPVVIFVTGGAWTIGYKAWGALLAKRLSENGVLVACLDYRNFPQGGAEQMLEDVNTGISWVCRKAGRYRGDVDNVVLVGQSAGGQLGALALIRQAEQAATGRTTLGAQPVWSPRDVRAFVGVSGAYDLEGLADHLHRRGLYKNLFTQIMSINGLPALVELSPVCAAKQLATGAEAHLPEVLLVHGTRDKSVPHASSTQLHEALASRGVRSSCRLIEGKTHTSFLLEGPMCYGRDMLMDMVMEVVTGREQSHVYSALCPWFLCELASWVCPF